MPPKNPRERVRARPAAVRVACALGVALAASLAGCAWVDGIDEPTRRSSTDAGTADATVRGEALDAGPDVTAPRADGAATADGALADAAPADAAPDVAVVCPPAPAGKCRLFHHDCPASQGCLVGDPTQEPVTTGCAALGASGQGGACSYGNDCVENLACIPGSPKGACGFWCILPDAAVPPSLDTCGLDRAAPGQGGCPSGMTCGVHFGAVSWLGECAP